jgi:hypothetical protein
MITISGQAPSHALAGAGFTYRLSPQFGFISEYNLRFFVTPTSPTIYGIPSEML